MTITVARRSAEPSPSLEKLVETGLCPDCNGELTLAPTQDNGSWEVVCTTCGLVVSEPHPIRAPVWLPNHSPENSLAFGNSLGGTLAVEDAKKILAVSSKNNVERRNAWFRAKYANSQFSNKASSVERPEVRKMKTMGKKLLQKLGLDAVNRVNDPMDLSHILADDYGRTLKKIGLYFQQLRDQRIKLTVNYEAVAEATLFQILQAYNPNHVHKYEWRFTVEDLRLVKQLV